MVAPLRVSESKIHAFVVSQQDWVIDTSNKIATQKQSVKKLAPEHYRDGVSVPFRGEACKIRLKPSDSNKLQIEFNQQEFSIFLPAEILAVENSELIKLSLSSWMKVQALKQIEAVVAEQAKKYNLYPRSIKIKTQKSRWGSCGVHNDINMNWLLILAPPAVLEYVVVHEICHIKERNHSANFWRLVDAHYPDYKKQRQWLKQNGHSLMQGL